MKRGFTLVEIMIVVAIIALLAAIAIPGLLRMRVNANETNAQATLRTISTAAEAYAAANSGNYPEDIGILVNATPKYLNEDYTLTTRQGYNVTCADSDWTAAGYSCSANPMSNSTGTRTFNISTGGVF